MPPSRDALGNVGREVFRISVDLETCVYPWCIGGVKLCRCGLQVWLCGLQA